MKIATVKINQDTWKVRMVEPDKKKMNPNEENVYLGLTEYQKGVINLRKGLSKSMIRSTVIHELTHAFIYSYGYQIDGEEVMCNFWGAQGDAILHMTNEIMKKVDVCCQRKK